MNTAILFIGLAFYGWAMIGLGILIGRKEMEQLLIKDRKVVKEYYEGE